MLDSGSSLDVKPKILLQYGAMGSKLAEIIFELEKPKIDLPFQLIRAFVKIFGKVPNFPLSLNRLNSLTNYGSYSSRNIEIDLGFSFAKTLENWITQYARELEK